MAQSSTVDVFLAALSQQPAAHAGPLGRIASLINGVCYHYLGATQTANGPTPAKLKIESRAGFSSLNPELRDVVTGAFTSDGTWSAPEVLSTLDSQLVSICDAIPRVSTGNGNNGWSYYGDTRVVSNILSQSVLHTKDRVIQVPSHAYVGSVKATVWTEVTYDISGAPLGTAYVGFKNGDVWVRQPSVLVGPGVANKPVLAKVVTDGTYFWTFANRDSDNKIVVSVFDTHGLQLATTTTSKLPASPGDWDVTYLTGGVVNYSVDPSSAQYAGSGVWNLSAAALLTGMTSAQLTVSGDPSSVMNGTFNIVNVPDHTHVVTSTSPTPLTTYSLPGSGSNNYLGSGTWTFASSAIVIPVGASVVVSGSSGAGLNGSYTVTAYNSSTHVATMTPSPTPPTGGRLIGAGATVLITYPASLPYSLSADTISISGTVPARVCLIQPTDTGTGLGVDFSTFSYSSFTITETRVTDTSARCSGPISWLTNDTVDSLGYFATAGQDADTPRAIIGYQATGAGQTHMYSTGRAVADVTFLDSLIGWVESSNTHQPAINIGVSYLADGSTSSAGPKYDPQLRSVDIQRTDWFDTTTPVRTNMSAIPVTRAFKQPNGEYAYASYYESGSGSVNTVAPIAVTATTGDFLSGGVSQPIKVSASDSVQGPAISLPGGDVGTTGHVASGSITAGDKVEMYTVVAGDALNGVFKMPVGSLVLKWTLAHLSAGTGGGSGGYSLSRLEISGCSEPTANGSWPICWQSQGIGTVVYTTLNDTDGSSVNPATFTATGSCEVLASAWYSIPTLDTTTIDVSTLSLYQTAVVSGFTHSGNNGTQGIIQFLLGGSDPNSGYYTVPNSAFHGVVVSLGAQVQEDHAPATIAITPVSPKRWSFAAGAFDDSFIGTTLVVDSSDPLDTTPPADTGSFNVTSTAPHFLQTNGSDAAGLVSHYWRSPPYPTVTVTQDLQKANRIRLGNVTFDYSLIGALISIQDSLASSANNGVYRVDSIDTSDAGNHTVFVTPGNGLGNQINQLLTAETITIFPSTSLSPVIQPTWFLTPCTGTQPQVGRFDDRLAYAGWRQDGQIVSGQPVPNLYPRALGDVTVDITGGINMVLPYRASGFVAGQLVVAPNGQVVDAADTTVEATIGLKTWTLSPESGDPVSAFNELLIPGPLATAFTESGFHEQGINLGMEAPFVVSEETDTSATVIGLTPKAKYIYQAIASVVDENGDVAYSLPSPAVEVTLTGTNNTVTIGGRTQNPLTTGGVPADGVFGMSNRKNLTIEIYRTAIVNGTPTTNLYRITNPLNSNGPLYSGTGPGSGFTFLSDNATWYYRDQNPDIVIVNAPTIPTGSQLPSFPAPAFRQGCIWLGRSWLCGTDGAVWMSNEKVEGRSLSFFPGFRFTFPSKAVACTPLDTNLYVFCEDKSIWTIPAATYPDATGNPQSGTLPTPRPTPFRNSCTGHATTIREGVVYSSTAGAGSQLWLISRNQQNLWLSQPIQDSLTNPVRGLAVDSKQRLFVTTGSALWCYDGIPELWSQALTQSPPLKIAALDGNLVYQDSALVSVQAPGTTVDLYGGTTYPIPLDITLAGLNFAQVRAYVRLWALQIIGEYRGPHKLNAILTYPDDMPGFPTSFLQMVPDPSKPYLLEINPTNELCSNFGLRIYSSFEGITDVGDSFTLELVSAKVGLRPGQRDVPASQRHKATTG